MKITSKIRCILRSFRTFAKISICGENDRACFYHHIIIYGRRVKFIYIPRLGRP